MTKLKPIPLFVLMATLILLSIDCDGISQTADTPTPEPKVVAKIEPPPTNEPPTWGLLASLPVEVSAVLATGPLLDTQRTFTGFGMPKTGNPEEASPQWEFAVLPGTSALAPVTGFVVSINTL